MKHFGLAVSKIKNKSLIKKDLKNHLVLLTITESFLRKFKKICLRINCIMKFTFKIE